MKGIKLLSMSAFCLAAGSVTSFAQTATPWQIKTDNPIIKFETSTDAKRKEAFSQGKIPAQNDGGWALAKTTNGKVDYAVNSRLKGCKQELDFTYFQTIVNVPANTIINTFTVSYDVADDGARIYFFNSKNPQGKFDEKADLLGASSKKESDLKSLVAPGENRIVIVQYDNCATKNNIQGIHLKLNGREILPEAKPVTDAITVYEHINYGGKSKKFGVGTHDITSTEFNDIISSVKIMSGYKVTLFKDWKATGNTIILNGDTPDLMKLNFNDEASTIKVEKL